MQQQNRQNVVNGGAVSSGLGSITGLGTASISSSAECMLHQEVILYGVNEPTCCLTEIKADSESWMIKVKMSLGARSDDVIKTLRGGC